METTTIPIAQIKRHPENARSKRAYSRAEIANLTASIRQHGLLQPLVVTQRSVGFTVLAGHRRLAALTVLKAENAPCLVLEADDDSAALSVLLTDNAQHRQVEPLKEAEAVAALVERFSGEKHSHDRAATTLGKSSAWVRARLRLTTLSTSWRAAFGNPDDPVSQFPIGHLEYIAALSDDVQEQAFQQWKGWWSEGIPLREDLRRMVADLTADLGTVMWDLADTEIVPDAPACVACPKRDSVQGDLFKDVAGVSDAKGDRCLDATCFEAKRRATVHAAVDRARDKHGDKLGVEVPWQYRDVPMPEGVKVYREHDLTPMTKAKGGSPVLRLRTMKIAYMSEASRSTSSAARTGSESLTGSGEPTIKSLDVRRELLGKRRLVRALDVLQGTLLNRSVHVGSKKHPEEVVPPEPKPPTLEALISYVLVYGTGPSVDPDGDGYDAFALDNDEEVRAVAADVESRDELAALRTRVRLWNRVREPIAKSLRTFSGVSLSATERMSATATSVCNACGLDWERDFHNPAAEAIPEPMSWSRLNEDGTPKRRR